MQSEQPTASALGGLRDDYDKAKALVLRAIPAVISSPFWMFILVRRRQSPVSTAHPPVAPRRMPASAAGPAF
jgi:hypothetical protein